MKPRAFAWWAACAALAAFAVGASCARRPPTPQTEPEFSTAPPEIEITPISDAALADLPEPDPAPEEEAPKPYRAAHFAAGRSPYGIGMSPNGAFLFVANHQDATMSVFATADHGKIATTPLGSEASPYAVAVHPTGHRVYVSTFNGGCVAAVESVRFTLVGEPARIGNFTAGMALTPDGKTLLVAAPLAHRVYRLDADTLRVIGQTAVGREPHSIVVSADGRAAYVTLGGADAVAVLSLPDGRLLGEPIPVGDSPRGIAVSPAGDLLAVAEVGSHTLTLVSTLRNEAVARVRVGRQPIGVAFSPYGRYVYVANFGSRSVMAVSVAVAQAAGNNDTANAVRARVRLASHPWAIALSGDGRLAYVTGQDRNVVEVIATNGML